MDWDNIAHVRIHARAAAARVEELEAALSGMGQVMGRVRQLVGDYHSDSTVLTAAQTLAKVAGALGMGSQSTNVMAVAVTSCSLDSE